MKKLILFIWVVISIMAGCYKTTIIFSQNKAGSLVKVEKTNSLDSTTERFDMYRPSIINLVAEGLNEAEARHLLDTGERVIKNHYPTKLPPGCTTLITLMIILFLVRKPSKKRHWEAIVSKDELDYVH